MLESVTDVVIHRAVEHDGCRSDITEASADDGFGHILHLSNAEGDAARSRIDQTRHQEGEFLLSAIAQSDRGAMLADRKFETGAVDAEVKPVLGVTDVVRLNFAIGQLE